MTRYEVILLDVGKYVTLNLSARSIQHLAEQILDLYPSGEFVSARES